MLQYGWTLEPWCSVSEKPGTQGSLYDLCEMSVACSLRTADSWLEGLGEEGVCGFLLGDENVLELDCVTKLLM